MNGIVFVCTGNTCRSPMAEGLYRAAGGEQKTGLPASSAGFYTVDGLPASENSVIAAADYGADLSQHHSHVLTGEIARDAAYLVCMTAAQYDRLLEQYPDCVPKLYTLLPEDVDDPFGGDLETYRKAAAQIDMGVKRWIERLQTR